LSPTWEISFMWRSFLVMPFKNFTVSVMNQMSGSWWQIPTEFMKKQMSQCRGN
jgi:hypothetical protein